MTEGRGLKQRLGSTGSLILGWFLVIIGFPLLPLPGPGMIVIAAGMALLSRHYVWARTARDWVGARAVESAKLGVETWPRIISSALGVENTPDAVSQALATNPDAAVKLAQIAKERAAPLQTLAVQAEQNRLAADTAAINAVNATMQVEDKADHWPTYFWRPFIGLSFGAYINSLWLLPLFKVTPVTLSTDLVMAIGGILGVASWFRGKAQAAGSVDPRG